MSIASSQMKAVKKYQDNHYDYIKFRMFKGDKEKLKEMAEAEGKSVNQFIYDKIFGNK